MILCGGIGNRDPSQGLLRLAFHFLALIPARYFKLGKFAAPQTFTPSERNVNNVPPTRSAARPRGALCGVTRGMFVGVSPIEQLLQNPSAYSEALSRMRRKGWPNRPLCSICHRRGGRGSLCAARKAPPEKDRVQAIPNWIRCTRLGSDQCCPSAGLLNATVSITFLSFDMEGKDFGAGDYPPTMSVSRLPSTLRLWGDRQGLHAMQSGVP